MTDPIVDMLNRIKNAQTVFHPTVSIPFSKLKYEIALILEKERFVGKVERRGKTTQKFIEIDLKYKKEPSNLGQKTIPAILGLKRVSRLGQRIYISSRDIKIVRSGYGISIISTSRGLMTNKEARKKGLGGEIICEAW